MNSVITCKQLMGAFIIGAKRLEEDKETINDLNVFPVPDGDTGTNMSMTVNSALTEVLKGEYDNTIDLCKIISQGSLRGARGNSGVILSQLFRGFYKVIKTENEVDTKVLANALTKATETAYRAVMKPKEGTILTIAKAVSDKAVILSNETDDIGVFYDGLVESAKEALDKTPEMLPVLKQAGVVDSGGTGLLRILEGASDYINNRDTDIKIHKDKSNKKEPAIVYAYELTYNIISNEIISAKTIKELETSLENLGKLKSINKKDNIISVSVSLNDPGKALSKSIKTGTLSDVVINSNIKQEKPKIKEKIIEYKDMGIVSVSVGDGLYEIFKGLGVDYCIQGGQTMNPSTEDILDAISKVNAKNVFILPNNKNILLASNQAADLCDDKKVYVIPTTTIPQGIGALLNFSPETSVKENIDNMSEEIKYIHSGEITYAVRDTIIDDKTIKEGDFMGIGDSGILSVEKNINKCAEKLVGELIDDESSLISIYFGKDIKEADAKKLVTRLSKKFPDMEIDLQNGGQPVYYYLLSVE